MGLSDFMIEVRVKTVMLGTRGFILSKWSATNVGWELFQETDDKIRFYIRDESGNAGDAESSGTYNNGKWHTIIALVDRSSATGMKIYIDGSEVAYDTQADPTLVGSVDNSDTFEVGARSGSLKFTGLIDELRVWNFGFAGLPADYEAYIAWRAAGRNVFLDIGQYNGGAWNGYADAYREEKVVDGGLENWDNNTPDDWTEASESGGVRDITKESTQKHGGSFATKLEATNNDETDFSIWRFVVLTGNKYYEAKWWTYFASRTAGSAYRRLYSPVDGNLVSDSDITLDADFTLDAYVFMPTTSETGNIIYAYLRNETTTGIVYFDDISVKRVGLVLYLKLDGTYDDETTNANHLTAGGTGNVFPGYTLKKNKIISPFWIK